MRLPTHDREEVSMRKGGVFLGMVCVTFALAGCSTPGEKRAKEAESFARAQEQIAERLGVSRIKAQRLIAAATQSGMGCCQTGDRYPER